MAAASEVQLNLDTWPYQTKDCVMVPYRQEATSFFPEDFLVSIYCRLLEEQLLDIVFPGMAINHLHGLINFLSSPAHPSLFCFLKDETGITATAGMGYITETDGRDGARKAGFGFGFMRDLWATQEARTLSWFMLHFWFVALKIDVLFGLTANPLARNFANNFGFTKICEIPKIFFRQNELQAGTLVMLEKETFLPLYKEWHEGIT